MDNVSNSRTIS